MKINFWNLKKFLQKSLTLKTTFIGATTTFLPISGSVSWLTSGFGSGSGPPNKLSQFDEVPDHGVPPEGERQVGGVVDHVDKLELDVRLLADVEVVQAQEEPVRVSVVDDFGVWEGRSDKSSLQTNLKKLSKQQIKTEEEPGLLNF